MAFFSKEVKKNISNKRWWLALPFVLAVWLILIVLMEVIRAIGAIFIGVSDAMEGLSGPILDMVKLSNLIDWVHEKD